VLPLGANEIFRPRSGTRIDGPQRPYEFRGRDDRWRGEAGSRRLRGSDKEGQQHRPTLSHYDAEVIRFAYLSAYAALAALGEALVARPALLWVRSQGLFHPALTWEVPHGGPLLACATGLALFTLWLASQAALQRKPRAPVHIAFLLVVGICFALRSASGNPRPPADPAPALLEGLRVAADELDRGYAGQYAPDAAQFSSALAQLPTPAFRRFGQPIPIHVRVLSAADGPQLEPLPGDQPATLYVAVSRDRHTAWLTALTLDGTLTLPSGKPATIEARSGSHSRTAGDAALPAYPRVRSGSAR
jgi:hypothetical protein